MSLFIDLSHTVEHGMITYKGLPAPIITDYLSREESLANLDGVVVRWNLARGRAIASATVKSVDIEGKAVLIHTGWDKHWRTDQYFEGSPFLTKDAVQTLIDADAVLVASTRSTSTIRQTVLGLHTHCFWAPTFPSLNICVILINSRIRDSDSLLCQSK